jgi:dipeptidyl aminopeptidase/acylaminoacyl peptidase
LRLACVWLLALCYAYGSSAAETRPLKLVDMLNLEGLGAVDIDPSGRRIVYEREPKYAERASFGIDAEWFEHSATGKLYLYDTAHDDESPHLLIASGNASSAEGMWLEGFSPHGTRLAVGWLDNGTVRAGVYDFTSGQLRTLRISPDIGVVLFGRGGPAGPIWLSDDELLYATLPTGQQPVMPDLRRAMARRLARSWEAAWRGAESTVAVSRTFSSRLDDAMQPGALMRVNAVTGEASAIADGRFFDFSLAPTKRYLAALQRGAKLSQDSDGQLRDPAQNVGFNYRHEAMLLDLEHPGDRVQLCPGYQIAEGSMKWSPRGDRLSFFAWPRNDSRANGTFFIYEIRSRARYALPHVGLALLEEHALAERPRLGIPLDDGVAVPARAQDNIRAPPLFPTLVSAVDDLTIEPSSIPVSTRRIDWYLLTAHGSPRNLTAMLSDVSPDLGVVASSNRIIIEADRDLWELKATGAEPRKLPSQPGGRISRPVQVRNWIVAEVDGRRSQFFLYDITRARGRTLSLPTEPSEEILTLSPERGLAVSHRPAGRVSDSSEQAQSGLLAMLSANARRDIWRYSEHLAAVRLPRDVRIQYDAADGEQAAVRVALPSDWHPGRRAPAVVFVYPGAPPASLSDMHHSSLELLTTLGYAVIFPERSSEAYRFFRSRPDSDPLGGWSDLVLPAIEAAVRAGYVDETRTGAYGVSQGSYSVLALIAQTKQFKAAVTGYGLYDVISAYGAVPIQSHLWPDDLAQLGFVDRLEMGYPNYGGAPWNRTEAYTRFNPLFMATQVSTPLMIIQSDLDGFPLGQADELYSTFVRLRKEAQYVRYWGEGHGVTSPANIKDQWARIVAWFDEYLDVSRDTGGNIAYDGSVPKSRERSPPWSPDDFMRRHRFFDSSAAQLTGGDETERPVPDSAR